MRLGIFGGSFNPVHSYHVKICRTVLEQKLCDRLLVIPVASPPHKTADSFLTDGQRLELLHAALSGIENTEISDIELQRGGRSYTSDTVAQLRRLYPADELFLVMGADMFLTLREWHEYESLIRECGFIVFRRGGAARSELASYGESIGISPERLILVHARESAVSSTALRRRLRAGKPVTELVPSAVENILVKRGKAN